ncbi:MAG TPA: FixH family protein [Lacipirellulaceae bacterium]|nr:FixH family protein [Lacipirellulaceae bacterium]
MSASSLVWGSPTWSWIALALAGLGAAALVWSYWRTSATPAVKLTCATLKILGLAGLALCLLEPLLSSTRARRGANMFAIVADNSQSMNVHDQGEAGSRGEAVHGLLNSTSGWQKRLSTDFDTRRFAFDSHLRSVDHFASLSFDGSRSSLNWALNSLSRRFRGLPLAGIMIITDGNATDAGEVAWDELPPVYPIVVGSDESPADVSVPRVTVSETNFDAAPVTVRADIRASRVAGKHIVASLFDEHGEELQTQTIASPGDDEPTAVRFQLRPKEKSVSFYRVRVAVGESEARQGAEATLANNERLAVVDRGGGPYRVLYVCGRPNWEFKFLRRALAEDDQLELLGLVRIARREPKFAFRSKAGESTNPLFSGFEHPDEESAERYDQPVLIRLGTKDGDELRDGFPKTADELYRYDAVILDDVEAGFFSQDQLTLLQNFVSRRGGGFLMLGGPDSFAAGRYDRTPVGSLLPVYVDQPSSSTSPGKRYRLALTHEGWLQPWVRTRQTEPEERKRLSAMPPFRFLTAISNIKPAATVLAEVVDNVGAKHPALVVQRFGRGRSGALLIGDFWRWGLRGETGKESDLEKSWRQTVRWLVADVPQRVEVSVRAQDESQVGGVVVEVRARDAEYLPLDNAQVSIEVVTPGGKKLALEAEACDDEPGAYQANYVPREPGAYRATVKASAPDGSPVGQREAGWVAQPAADEFQNLRPNRARLEEIAAKTGGQLIEVKDLDGLVASLPTRKAPITEPWIRPAWHHPLFYLAIIGCLVGEWGLRRWKGLA